MTLGDGIPVTIECKNEKKINLAGAAKELADEMRNNGHQWGFAVHKKRGTTDVGKYYAVLPVEVLMDILEVALKAKGWRVPARRATSETRKRVIPRSQPD